ncbi:NAD-dependent epimerase/dehydratase family protein [Actinomadura fibrosa]|uniref:NAD-dependent epimerase/dehydratase family protein n=1 Tax=Actinomadura fibrosa TaxID=111802 RepID=A0ABW2XP47_9ACTN|nr:NAD(P)-dependent oxidoreductase [Actinomadura fibrosa]
MTLGTIVLTGAAGRIGTALRTPLRDEAARLVLADRAPLHVEAPNEVVHRTDLNAGDAVRIAEGADAIVHLAGIPDEAPLPDLVEANVLGTHRVLEAARLTGVPRVVIASSNRVTGFHPSTETVSPASVPRPDGLYGASKAAVEALAHVYADKFGLDVVCLRIGSFELRPSEPRHLSTWLSHRDCAGFVRAALTVPSPGFLVAYAVSANPRRFWELDERLGYEPKDDAATYGVPDTFVSPDTPQSGRLASAEFTLPHLGTPQGAGDV